MIFIVLMLLLLITVISNDLGLKKVEIFQDTYPKDRILFITFETDLNHKNLNELKKSLNKQKYPFKILTAKKWTGFGLKIQTIYDYIKTLPDNKIVIISDARDVLCVNYDVHSLFNKIKNIVQEKIILSTEIGCCVNFQQNLGNYRTKSGKVLKRTYEEGTPNSKNWKSFFNMHAERNNIKHKNVHKKNIHINAGIYIGTVKNIKTIYSIMNPNDKEDDQILLSEMFYLFPNKFVLDYNRNIISNSHVWDTNNTKIMEEDSGCTYKKEGKLIKDTYSNTYPYFIHTPGKHFKCFDGVRDLMNI